jgi:transposase
MAANHFSARGFFLLLQAELIKQAEKTEVVLVETLDHLGIVAGLVDKLKLVERIDARISIAKAHGAIVTHGESIKAMIINGLGFTQNPIYLSPTCFEGKDVFALMGEGIEAKHLNDDVHGRTLDAIYQYGTTSLLAELANEIPQEFKSLLMKFHKNSLRLQTDKTGT